jgi:ubiquinone/menaquinone biosynthesis C-methylase UbiE
MTAMHQKLQHNFDIIQYLVKNASPQQLIWRKDENSWSLADILCRLRDAERWHARVQVPVVEGPGHISPPLDEFDKDRSTAAKYAFEAYAYYRQKTLALFQDVFPGQWQCPVIHRLFGAVTLAELVEIIDEFDQIHIHQIEDVIHNMPLNPLYARALHEISDYHRRYQPHLARATSLLDIGVGSGLALQYVMQQNPHLTFAGVDIRDLRLPDVNVPLQVYEGYMLPYGDNQFDVSLIFYVLHHCQHPHHLLGEAIRVTRQKLIIIEEFHRPGADPTSLDLTERQSHRALGIPPDLPYRLFDQPEFEEMLRKHNLFELEQQLLPSQTTRPVEKYLYVGQVAE